MIGTDPSDRVCDEGLVDGDGGGGTVRRGEHHLVRGWRGAPDIAGGPYERVARRSVPVRDDVPLVVEDAAELSSKRAARSDGCLHERGRRGDGGAVAQCYVVQRQSQPDQGGDVVRRNNGDARSPRSDFPPPR